MTHLLLLLFACTEPPQLKGRVVDIWNEPVEGATVLMEGAGERPLTDEFGVYSMKVVPGKHEMKAGKKGYIQEAVEVELKEGDKEGPVFQLYRKPDDIGFYAVTVGDYLKLEPATVKVVGHDLDALYGIENPSEKIYVEGDQIRIVYRIDLAMHQLQQLGLEIRKLKYIAETTMVSVGGGQETPVPIHMWVDDGDVKFDLVKLKSKGHYLMTTTEPLDHDSMYVVQAQDLLTPKDPDTWKAIPESLRTVHPIFLK
ncbi:MAG: hypothetical protein R3F61_05070 [Myxococcota bacterium]